MGRIALGLQIGHDRSAALIQNGVILAAIEEERLDRTKHSPGKEPPLKAMYHCLQATDTALDEIDDIVVTSTRHPDELQGLDLFKADRVTFISHHLAHAAAGFMTSPWDRAAILVADGSGGKVEEGAREAETVFVGEGAGIRLLSQRVVPDTKDLGATRTTEEPEIFSSNLSLGNLYSAASRLIFGDWRYSGKVMALAGLGDEVEANPEKCRALLDVTTERQPRLDEPAGFAKAVEVAATVHSTVKTAILAMAQEAITSSGSERLCFGGGVAYNCVINSDLSEAVGADNLFIFPACGDAGNSVGAGLLVSGVRCSEPSVIPPFFGGSWAEGPARDAIYPYLRKNYVGSRCTISDPLPNHVLIESICEDLLRYGVIGIHRGRSELGPRALGHRSLLANPALPGITSLLNRLKGREWFRPFGVLLRKDRACELFPGCGASPFMLKVGRLADQYAACRWDVSHPDGTTRLQTVTELETPFMFALLHRWEEVSNVPYVINTSFNAAGEPLVESPVDAIRSALRLGVKVLYVGGTRISFGD